MCQRPAVFRCRGCPSSTVYCTTDCAQKDWEAGHWRLRHEPVAAAAASSPARLWVGDPVARAQQNTEFRALLFTTERDQPRGGDRRGMQAFVQSLAPEQAVPFEVHDDGIDQLIVLTQGSVLLRLLRPDAAPRRIEAPGAFMVPSGMAHGFANESTTEAAKFFTVYSGIAHPAAETAETAEAGK